MKEIKVSELWHMVLPCLLLAACGSPTVYNLPDVTLHEFTLHKRHVKTDAQFISIAYTDLFGRSIPQGEMDNIKNLFLSQGDQSLNYSGYISYLLKEAGAYLPDESVMQADIESFVETLYLGLLNRKPGKYEVHNLSEAIKKNTGITVRDIYFAVMTSEEYRRY